MVGVRKDPAFREFMGTIETESRLVLFRLLNIISRELGGASSFDDYCSIALHKISDTSCSKQNHQSIRQYC